MENKSALFSTDSSVLKNVKKKNRKAKGEKREPARKLERKKENVQIKQKKMMIEWK